MILDRSEVAALQRAAGFFPTETGFGCPALELAGVRVAAYLVPDEDDGLMRVRISVGVDEADERLRVGEHEAVPLELWVQGAPVWRSTQ
ncbi:hypothetical protein [Streptomyces albogriseolus]|uniref:hypothetical protein n=1 Tax=Streptomyces albogriseolus TaxID=1887 RepID=UPI0034611E25